MVLDTKIIINADDFGLGAGIDEGVIRLAEQRKISSISVVACGQHFEAGVKALLQRAPDLGTGIHLCLNEETPVLPAFKIPSLVDPSGKFYSRKVLYHRLIQGVVNLEEVELEFIAQVKKVLGSGMRVTHLDSHGHIHVLPWLAGVFQSISRRFDIDKTRMPFEPFSLQQGNWSKRTAVRILLNYYTCLSRRKGFLAYMHTPDNYFGVSVSGRLSRQDLLGLRIRPGQITEIMAHPGLPTEDDLNRYSHWNYSWRREYEALTGNLDLLLKNISGTLVDFREVGSSIKSAKKYWEHHIVDWEKSAYERKKSDSLAENAATLFRGHIVQRKNFCKLMLIDKIEGKRILDLGSGTGCLLRELTGEGKPACAVGWDISEEAVRIGNAVIVNKGLSNVCRLECKNIDGNLDGVRDFDFIYGLGVLEYLQPKTIFRLFERLKDRFFFFQYHRKCFSLPNAVHLLYRSIKQIPVYNQYSKGQLVKICADAGISTVDIQCVDGMLNSFIFRLPQAEKVSLRAPKGRSNLCFKIASVASLPRNDTKM